MPTCDEIVALLSDYLDRDLPPESCAAVDAHLASCAKCGEDVDALRRTVRMCREFRAESRPGPLPPEQHEEMVSAFRKALTSITDERK